MRSRGRRARTLSRVEVVAAGRAAMRVAGKARVFAAFERSCYVEANGAIACLGADIGLGPLNAQLKERRAFEVGVVIELDFSSARAWIPKPSSGKSFAVPAQLSKPWQKHSEAQAFLRWLAGKGEPDDALIGLGAGLTPAGDDFVGGAMIALRAAGHADAADRIAAWALPLAARNTSRISRAHLECAAAGEGHEFLHELLSRLGDGSGMRTSLNKLSRVGHTSGLDAAAGALLSLKGRNA